MPDKKPEPLKLPESCEPLFLDSDRGLGVLICDAFDGEVGIFVKTADSDWALETRMPVEISKNSQLISADDGTIAVMGKCYEEIIPASDASDESVQMPET